MRVPRSPATSILKPSPLRENDLPLPPGHGHGHDRGLVHDRHDVNDVGLDAVLTLAPRLAPRLALAHGRILCLLRGRHPDRHHHVVARITIPVTSMLIVVMKQERWNLRESTHADNALGLVAVRDRLVPGQRLLRHPPSVTANDRQI